MFVGRNYERADLRAKDLRGVNFTSCNFRAADFSGSDLRGTILINADLSRSCLHNVDARGAILSIADLTGAYMKGADFRGANLWHAYLKGVIAKDTKFHGANMTGVDIARGDFLGARFDDAETDGMSNIETAVFHWFVNPAGGRPHATAFPGAMVMTRSLMGTWSFQENSGLGQSMREYQPGDPESFPSVTK